MPLEAIQVPGVQNVESVGGRLPLVRQGATNEGIEKAVRSFNGSKTPYTICGDY